MNRYSIGTYIGLALLLLVALVYAIPNLYGQDPAVVVSTNQAKQLSSDQVNKVKSLLKKQNFNYRAMESHHGGVLIRFQNSDTQIKARDYLRGELGREYTVALNLAPRTPQWLQSIGAHPMRLGLDLRGGVHFLLKVETDFAVQARVKGDLHGMAEKLRQQNIRYTGIDARNEHNIVLRFDDKTTVSEAYSALERQFNDYVFRQDKVDGHYRLKAIFRDNALSKIRDYSVSQAMTILKNRVNALGTSEAVVQRQGQDHISVALPGIQDTARAKQLIGKTATVQFKLVDSKHDVQQALEGDIPTGSKLYKYKDEGRHVLLKRPTILEGSAITYASAGFDQSGGASVNIRLGGGGETRFHRKTAENVGKQLAVVYVETKPVKVDKNGKMVTEYKQKERVISVATIQQALGNRFQITGLQSQQYAQNLALLLRSGALKAPVHTVQEQTVGPSLGQSNINKGLTSLEVGSLIVILFMALYYRVFGLIADLALFLNVVFIVAILSVIGATLTLPGIAGIVLTVGMAVDANVLVYERIREELRNKMTPQAAIHAGYERAFSTIVDANVTTLIVAVVLYALGTGSVRGFAVTVIVGIFTSMLTSIYYSRATVNLVYGGRRVKNLSIGISQQTGS